MKFWQQELINQYKTYGENFDHLRFLDEFESQISGQSRDSKRRKIKRIIKNLQTDNTKNCLNQAQNTQTTSNNFDTVLNNYSSSCSYDNGNYIYDRIIEISKGEVITPELIMKAHNIDPNKWEVVTYKNNFWNSQQKDNKVVELYQSKLTVKPIQQKQITFDDIDNYFAKKDWETKPKVLPFKYDNTKESLEIDFCDTHMGLLSWRDETGADYDIHIAAERFKETFSDFVRRCDGRKFKVINFVTLGDILHIDNNKNETAHGTRQDVDGRLSKMFDFAVDTIIDCIDILLTLECPVRYTYTCGNHDTFSGYALAKCIQKAFCNNPNVEFDVSPNPQKIYRYGNSLVGYCHGDMNQKNLGEWLQKKYRKEFGECRFAEVHCGHLHSEGVKENCGVLIKHLPTICESSYWEHSEGYNSDKGLMAFIYNDDTGLRETWYTYL